MPLHYDTDSRIENLIIKSSEEEHRRVERELAVISNDISSTFGNRLDNTLKQELASCILPRKMEFFL